MYTCSIRHLFRLVQAVSLVDPNEMYSHFEMAKLWSSEAYRTLVDRVEEKDERKMFNMIIQQLAEKNFSLSGPNEKLPSKPGRPIYTNLLQHNEE